MDPLYPFDLFLFNRLTYHNFELFSGLNFR